MAIETPDLIFHPPLPATRMGELKDMAQEVIVASATLDGRIASDTALALGDRLRFLNSYYSNLIEGHKTSVLEIESALEKVWNAISVACLVLAVYLRIKIYIKR